MVSKKNQVLLGMLSLDTFTTEELSRFSRVGLPTVRTVIERNVSKLEKIAVEATNRRGGQPIRYCLTDEGRKELAATVDETSDRLKKARAPFFDVVTSFLPLRDVQLPLGLRIADDTLERLVPNADSDAEKLELLEIAQRETRGSLQELPLVDPGFARRIEKEVQDRLARIERERAAIESRKDEFVPWMREEAWRLPVGIQVITGIPKKSALTKRVVKDLEGNAEILLSELTQQTTQTPEAVDAVILIVDSSNIEKARTQFDSALKIVSRPLAILDKGYDVEFRDHVYCAGITAYCNDAAGLSSKGMRGLVGSILQKPDSKAIRVESPLMEAVAANHTASRLTSE